MGIKILLTIGSLIWILLFYFLGSVFGSLFLQLVSTSSFVLWTLSFFITGLAIGLIASLPIFLWLESASGQKNVKKMLLVLIVLIPAFYMCRIQINMKMASIPKPPDASSSTYEYKLENAISLTPYFRFYWHSETPDQAFLKMKNAARLYDTFFNNKGWITYGNNYNSSEKISCEDAVDRRRQLYEESLRAGKSLPLIFAICEIRDPDGSRYELQMDETHGRIFLPT